MDSSNTIWDIARAHSDEGSFGKTERTLLVTGSANCGKTTLIQRFLDKDESLKPSVGLEYRFARRSKGQNAAKDVGHIWELGGKLVSANLLDMIITEQSISTLGVLLFLDMSRPSEMWETLETFLVRIREKVKDVFAVQPKLAETSCERAANAFGTGHPDLDVVDLLPVPVVIVGANYDKFANTVEPERRKLICGALRYVAHIHGSSLIFYSTTIEFTGLKMRQLMGQLLFSTSFTGMPQTDFAKPLLITSGQDSLQDIGNPPQLKGVTIATGGGSGLDRWRQAYLSVFPQQADSQSRRKHGTENYGNDPQYQERIIDDARRQKDQELERYKKLCEKRTKEKLSA